MLNELLKIIEKYYPKNIPYNDEKYKKILQTKD